MPEIKVKIKWDTPKDKEWLVPDIIQIALSKYCKNTLFQVEELKGSKTND